MYNRVHYLKIALSCLVILLLIICTKKIYLTTNKVEVSVEALVSEDDVFQFFYLPKNIDGYFKEEFSIKTEVSGSEKTQKIVFFLADTISLRRLRLDIGNNGEQNSILIKSININYNDNALSFEGPEILQAFKFNQFISIGSNDVVFNTHQKNNRYDPFIYTEDISLLYSQVLKKDESRLSFGVIILVTLLLIVIGLLFFVSKKDNSKKTFYFSYSFFFLLLLVLPFFDKQFDIDNSISNEKRELAKKPNFDFDITTFTDYTKKYESYFNDNFGFRQLLVDWGSKLKVLLFNSSSLPDKVAVGKNNWFFLSDESLISDLSHQNLYSPRELSEKIKQLEERKKWLNSQNIHYFNAVWPNKATIYPEFLPYFLQIQKKDNPSRLDQLINGLKEKNSSVKIVDVRENIKKSKEKRRLYYKYDTHWNHYGAFIGYKALIDDISVEVPSIKSKRLTDFNVKKVEHAAFDLLFLLGLQDKADYKDYKFNFTPRKNNYTIKSLNTSGYPKKTIIHENKEAANQLTVLIFRDSFTSNLVPFISPHFNKVVYIWGDYNKKMVEKVNPDIVIESNVERFFE